jgi:hypothetical protein
VKIRIQPIKLKMPTEASSTGSGNRPGLACVKGESICNGTPIISMGGRYSTKGDIHPVFAMEMLVYRHMVWLPRVLIALGSQTILSSW